MKSPLLFSLLTLFNLAGACLEGGAYLFILFSFTALSGAPLPSYIPQMSFYFLLGIAVLLQLLKSLFCFLAGRFTARLTEYLQHSTQLQLYKKIGEFSFAQINRYKTGELNATLAAPTSYYRPFLEHLNQCITYSSLIFISMIILFAISWKLSLIVLTLFAAAFFLQKFSLKKNNALSTKLCSEIDEFNVHTTQSLQALRFIHLYNLQTTFLDKMDLTCKRMAHFAKKITLLNNLSLSFGEVVGILLIALCLILGVVLLPQNNLLATLLTFITIAYRLSNRMTVVSYNLSQMSALSGYRKKIQAFLNEECEKNESSHKRKFLKLKQGIRFENLTFAYHAKGGNVLENLSFMIHKGESVAFVGKSGAGKSSLIDLLSGLYHPTAGTILLDDTPLSSYDLHSYRQKLSVVSQETFLFAGTIRENIGLGHLHANFEDILSAAKKAHAHEFIMRLEKGYETFIGERGYRLSGGEKQRIALARALLRDPEILILDEATSNLDTIAEKEIQEALHSLRGEKTLIFIAHRLSMIKEVDHIFVIERGKLLESGTHHGLLQRDGHYSHLWHPQKQTIKTN